MRERRAGAPGGGPRDFLPNPERLGKWPREARLPSSGSEGEGGLFVYHPQTCLPAWLAPRTLAGHPAAPPSPPPSSGTPSARSPLRQVAPAFLAPHFALCKLEGGGEVREGSGEPCEGFRPPHRRVLAGLSPRAPAGPEKGAPWAAPWARSAVNLAFPLKRVRECFPLSRPQAAPSGLAVAPALVHSLGEKTSSLLIQERGEGEEEEEERASCHTSSNEEHEVSGWVPRHRTLLMPTARLC